MIPHLACGGLVAGGFLENRLKVVGPSVVGRADDGSVLPEEGDSDLQDGG